MSLIFVYGTLKQGGANHRWLDGQRCLGPALTRPEWGLYALDDYPGLVPARGGGRAIAGEIWEVDAACLARLDAFEGVDAGLYARAPITLQPPHESRAVETYVYLRSIAGRSEIDSW